MSFTKTISQLRSTTGLPVLQCQDAANQAGGDYDRALGSFGKIVQLRQ